MNLREKAGGCLTLLALPCFSLAVFMYLDPKEGQTAQQSLVPGLFFGTSLLLPGLLAYFTGKRARLEAEFVDAVAAMIRSHDRFAVAELARKIGRTELETEGLVHRILSSNRGIDLVFHRSTREYVHRARLGAGERLVEKCPACGAPTAREIVMHGESVACTYCGKDLAAG